MKPTLLLNLIGLLFGAGVSSADELSFEQQHGREIYHRGTVAGAAAGSAAIGADGMLMPSSMFMCANCHGIWGEGSREGGIDTPPLDWKRLTSPAVSTATGRRRAPYTPVTLRRAITQGLDPAGMRLHAGMPRYSLPSERLNELVAYLERIGDADDTDPGVTAKSIRIGAALPLSGPQASAGKSIRETLELLFAAESRGGAIYGRSIELAVEDSRGDAEGFLEATRRLVEKDSVFALVASLSPVGGSDDTARVLESVRAPLIGPVTLSPRQNKSPNPYVFYLLPSLYDQARALVDFIAARDLPRQPRLAVIHSGTALDLDIVEGLRSQASMQGLSIVSEERDYPGAAAAILSKHPDYLIFSGAGAGLAAVARQLNGDTAPVLAAFVSMAQSGVDLLPQAVAARTLLVAPAFPPDTHHAEKFFTILEAGNSPHTFLGLRMAAFAAGSVLVQALRSSGSRLSRNGLVHTLERLQHLETGITAPLTFGPGQRVGSTGAVILSYEPIARTFVSASGWLAPKDPF